MDFYDENENEEKTYEQRLEDYAKEKEANPTNIDKYDHELERTVKLKEWESLIKKKTPGIKEYYYSTSTTNLYDDIQVIVITKDQTYMCREKRQGSAHYDEIAYILGEDQIDNIVETANKHECIMMLFSDRSSPIATVLPEEINFTKYQISELERINEEVREINLVKEAKAKITFDYELYNDSINGSLNTLIEVAKNNLEEEKTL